MSVNRFYLLRGKRKNMLLKIEHTTEYHYSEPQRMIVQSHRLYPSDCNSQKVRCWDISCEGANFGDYFHDGAGDCIRTMSINNYVDSIKIKINGEVDTTDNSGVVELARDTVIPEVYLRSSEKTRITEALAAAASESVAQADGDNCLNQAHAMTDYVSNAIKYTTGTTDSSFTADEALRQGLGVCQDQTHCLIALARINGIPARYVAGYLFTDGLGQRHDASHAWAELYISDLGWVGFDATNGCCPDERYVRLGCGVDAQDAALLRGISRGIGSESLATSVKISGMQQ